MLAQLLSVGVRVLRVLSEFCTSLCTVSISQLRPCSYSAKTARCCRIMMKHQKPLGRVSSRRSQLEVLGCTSWGSILNEYYDHGSAAIYYGDARWHYTRSEYITGCIFDRSNFLPIRIFDSLTVWNIFSASKVVRVAESVCECMYDLHEYVYKLCTTHCTCCTHTRTTLVQHLYIDSARSDNFDHTQTWENSCDIENPNR